MDRGWLHGLGLFETLLAVEGRPVRWPLHHQRLQASARRLGWSLPDFDLAEAIGQLLERNGLASGRARVRLALSGGSGSLKDLGAGEDRLCWLSATRLAPEPDGLKLAIGPWRRNEHSPLAGLKCASYAENLVALDWARRQGLDEVLFLNTAGELCEAACANLFVVRDGQVMTPPLGSGCLAGIARGVILGCAAEAGIVARECALGPDELESAEECFLTSATGGVMPVVDWGDGPRQSGPVTTRLREAWAQTLTRQ